MKTLVSKTHISYGNGRTARPGDELILPDDEAGPLIENGAAEISEQTPHELAALGSAELGGRIAHLEEEQARARESVAFARASETLARRELSDPDPKKREQARKTIAKARDEIDSAESMFARVQEETNAQLEVLRVALEDAKRIEARAQREQEAAAEAAAQIRLRGAPVSRCRATAKRGPARSRPRPMRNLLARTLRWRPPVSGDAEGS